MDIYPAIDIKGGRVVCLTGGGEAAAAALLTDPVAQAEAFAADGARWLHVVDIDRAFETGLDNIGLVRRICGLSGVAVQVGGNVTTFRWAQDALDAGADRVVLGSAAALDEARFEALVGQVGPDRAALAVDVRSGVVALRDSSAPVPLTVDELVGRARALGVSALIHRDLARDGLLAGADLEGAAALVRPDCEVIAAGGLADLGEVQSAARLGLAGVIVGRALHEGCFTLRQAVACLE